MSRRDNELEWEGDLIEAEQRTSRRSVAGAGTWSGRGGDVFGDLRTATHLGRVAKSTRRTYAQRWRMWVSWRIMRKKGNWLGNEMDEGGLADELTIVRGLLLRGKEELGGGYGGDIDGGYLYHEQWGGLSLPWKKFGINDVDKIVKRAPAEAENHARVKRPLTWEIMRVMEESIGDWGIAWRIG